MYVGTHEPIALCCIFAATVGEDFVALEQELVFGPEDEELGVSLLILNDEIVEESEVVRLVLAPGEGERAVQVVDGGIVNGVIMDDDDGKGRHQFSPIKVHVYVRTYVSPIKVHVYVCLQLGAYCMYVPPIRLHTVCMCLQLGCMCTYVSLIRCISLSNLCSKKPLALPNSPC